MANGPMQVVEKHSSVLGLPIGEGPGQEEAFPIPPDHREMVRFHDPYDLYFQQTWKAIRSIIDAGQKLMRPLVIEDLGDVEEQSCYPRASALQPVQRISQPCSCDGTSLVFF